MFAFNMFAREFLFTLNLFIVNVFDAVSANSDSVIVSKFTELHKEVRAPVAHRLED